MRRRRKHWLKIVPAGLLGAVSLGLLSAGQPAQAHPMGNFAICHYTRIEAERDLLRVRYILDMAEIPTVGEKAALDADRDGLISEAEKAAYLAAKGPELRTGLTLTVNGKPVPLKQTRGEVGLFPGAGGLDTLKIALDLQAPFRLTGSAATVEYRDGNYAERAGWKEIAAVGGRGATLQDSSVPSADRSRELTAYPPDAIPPQETEARFTIVPGGRGSTGQQVSGPLSHEPFDPLASVAGGSTPQDAFTQAIAHRELTPGLMLAGLLIAFVFGALHALSPGHGKAMVAAYLVGARGTAMHAVVLGLVVTITHTLGVFLLGIVTLFASHHIVPEKLYPILSVVSGLAVFGVGIWLLANRLRSLSDDHHHHPHPHHDHDHDHLHDHDGLDHHHPPHHGHSHGHGHHHHHLPEGPVTARALVALGVSGGIVPCPSALVVLLAAVALHRIGYGLLLISAFSLGVASVLVALGLLVVWARGWMDRLPTGGALLRRLPVASAAAITLIGVVLIVRALGPGAP